jgi:hypothetical protein
MVGNHRIVGARTRPTILRGPLLFYSMVGEIVVGALDKKHGAVAPGHQTEAASVQ